jgi:hypothetical protein
MQDTVQEMSLEGHVLGLTHAAVIIGFVFKNVYSFLTRVTTPL